MRSIPRLDLPRGTKLETIEGLPPDWGKFIAQAAKDLAAASGQRIQARIPQAPS